MQTFVSLFVAQGLNGVESGSAYRGIDAEEDAHERGESGRAEQKHLRKLLTRFCGTFDIDFLRRIVQQETTSR